MAESFRPGAYTNEVPGASLPSLPPPPGNKRNRRMRSVQGQLGGGDKKKGKGAGKGKDQEFLDLERSGATPFIIKIYQMISTCKPDLAEWSDDGETFVVKNTTKLANIEIPKYFDHKNFSSFSRQLNFYGFKKVPNKTIRIDQTDKSASGFVRFYNDKFKRGRTDLLNKIQRSTKNGGNTQNQAQAQEMRALKEKVSSLETQVSSMSFEMRTLQDQVRQLVDSSSSGMQQNVPQDYQNQASRMNPNAETYDYGNGNGYNGQSNNYATQQYTSSRASTETQWQNNPNPGVSDTAGPTLAPHPNTKQVDPNLLPPPPMDVSADRHATFLRGFSTGFDESLFEGPDGVTSSTVDLNQGNMIDQGNMMARIQSLDISGVYNHKANTSVELPPVDNERNIESQVGV